MKLAFSTMACPQWGLDAIASHGKALGFEGVEITGGDPADASPAWHEFAQHPAESAARLREAGLPIIALGLDDARWADRSHPAQSQSALQEAIGLAAAAECRSICLRPAARISKRGASGASPTSKGGGPPNSKGGGPPERAGWPPGGRESALLQISDVLRKLAPAAAEHQVNLLLQNAPPLAGSGDIWFILDAVRHPAVGCCWDPVESLRAGESASVAVPRLSRMIRLVHISDVKCGPDGRVLAYALPGQGNADVERVLDLLRGIGYAGYLVFASTSTQLGLEPEQALAGAATGLRQLLEKLAAVKELTAYKGEKNAPKFAPRRTPER